MASNEGRYNVDKSPYLDLQKYMITEGPSRALDYHYYVCIECFESTLVSKSFQIPLTLFFYALHNPYFRFLSSLS